MSHCQLCSRGEIYMHVSSFICIIEKAVGAKCYKTRIMTSVESTNKCIFHLERKNPFHFPHSCLPAMHPKHKRDKGWRLKAVKCGGGNGTIGKRKGAAIAYWRRWLNCSCVVVHHIKKTCSLNRDWECII